MASVDVLLLLLEALPRVAELKVVAGGAVVTAPEPDALDDPDVASAPEEEVDSTFPPAESELGEAGGGGGTDDEDDGEAGDRGGRVGKAGRVEVVVTAGAGGGLAEVKQGMKDASVARVRVPL